jgi:predicted AAA+ superfamily ATPase
MYRRGLEARVHEALADRPVVTIVGPRQSGKSTLALRVVHTHGEMRYVTLDTATTMAAATSDPEGFLAHQQGPLAIDEVQRAPGLFRAIKAEVDRRRTPGRFLLTGSANVLVLPAISESLAGRMEILRLLPLSERERRGRAGSAVDVLFDGDRLGGMAPPAVSRAEVVDRIVRGGFPEAQRTADERRRTEWFRSYESALVQRDVRDIAQIEDVTALPRLLRLLAARTGRIANFADLARDARLNHMTARRYCGHLEALFLVAQLPVWARNQSKRMAKAPKLVFVDTGLAAFLLNASAARIEEDGSLFGPLLETFVVCEMDRQRTWSERSPSLLHYRTHAGLDVDIVIEDRDGRVAGVEVKAASAVSAQDFAGLASLAEDAGRQFAAGIVLYLGRDVVAFGDRMFAMPLSYLWSDPPR